MNNARGKSPKILHLVDFISFVPLRRKHDQMTSCIVQGLLQTAVFQDKNDSQEAPETPEVCFSMSAPINDQPSLQPSKTRRLMN